MSCGAITLFPGSAAADAHCGSSGGHMVCVTLPSSVLTGEQTVAINVTSPGKVIATWLPDGGDPLYLMTQATKNPGTKNDFSFVWPTQKYLDATGVLRIQVPSTSSAPVDTPATLDNGNLIEFQHSPQDWATYSPGAWTDASDPVVTAVGDAAANEVKPNALAATIAASDPALFLYLGDIYEQGTFTEDRNHYGASALDDPSTATLFGVMARVTQPTVGNHEAEGPVSHLTDWQDYWHGRPDVTSFDFGGVRFLDLDSNIGMRTGSPQFELAQDRLESADAPACIVGYWHVPAINGGKIPSAERDIWKLFASHGGDLVITGHVHNMTEYVPLDATFEPSADAHMRELISGAGGHSLAKASSDPNGRIAWSLGKTAGYLSLTLDGAAAGASATSLSWTYRDSHGDPLAGSSGSVVC
jgi:hypothetical protein